MATACAASGYEAQPAFVPMAPAKIIPSSFSLDPATWGLAGNVQQQQQFQSCSGDKENQNGGMQDLLHGNCMLWTVGGLVPYKPFVASDESASRRGLAPGYNANLPWSYANPGAEAGLDCFANLLDGKWNQQKVSRRRGSRQKAKMAAAAAAAATVPAEYMAYYSDMSEEATNSSENEDGSSTEPCPFTARWGQPIGLCHDEALSGEVTDHIMRCEPEEMHALVMWLLRCIRPLAFSRHGTHIVQKLIELAGKTDKEIITAELKPCVRELYESAHGNHALAKIIEQLPSASVVFVVREFLGKAREVARHQYGCRILERLLEHCPDDGEMVPLIDEIVYQSEPLCRHPFGNFVVQHLLEHGSPERREAILSHVMYKLPSLAMHRTASHFVQQLLDYSEPENQQLIVQKLLEAPLPESFVEVAGSRYGSFVVEQIASLEASYDQVRAALVQAVPFFTPTQLKFAKRVLDRFNLNVTIGI